MIVGSGMIGKKFIEYQADDSVVIFASGVSNSTETRSLEFEREKELLLKTIEYNDDKLLIYFSSCYLENHSMHQEYYKHKTCMEQIIQNASIDYIIFRLPQVVGKTNNKFTLFGFLVNSISNHKSFALWKEAKRNLIDIDDVYLIIDYIIQNRVFNNRVINIASTCSCSIVDIVKKLEAHLEIKAEYNIVNKGDTMDIDISDVLYILDILKIHFNEKYLETIINKYVPHQNLNRNLYCDQN